MQGPARQRLSDGVLGEGLALGAEHARARFQAARSQGDVGRDDDVAPGRPLGDPVVGLVEARADDDELDAWGGRDALVVVRDEADGELVASGDP